MPMEVSSSRSSNVAPTAAGKNTACRASVTCRPAPKPRTGSRATRSRSPSRLPPPPQRSCCASRRAGSPTDGPSSPSSCGRGRRLGSSTGTTGALPAAQRRSRPLAGQLQRIGRDRNRELVRGADRRPARCRRSGGVRAPGTRPRRPLGRSAVGQQPAHGREGSRRIAADVLAGRPRSSSQAWWLPPTSGIASRGIRARRTRCTGCRRRRGLGMPAQSRMRRTVKPVRPSPACSQSSSIRRVWSAPGQRSVANRTTLTATEVGKPLCGRQPRLPRVNAMLPARGRPPASAISGLRSSRAPRTPAALAGRLERNRPGQGDRMAPDRTPGSPTLSAPTQAGREGLRLIQDIRGRR